MDRKVELKIYKEKSILDITEKNALYCIKADNETTFRIFVTDKFGNIVYLKDDTGTGGGGTITNIISSDATLEISGTTIKDIKIAPAVLTTISNALQPGDNVSALLNDANYITLADIPAFNPSDYDLSDFTNTSGDPFARISDIPSGNTNLSYTASPTQGTVTSDTGNDATIPLADNTNAGLFSPTEKNKLAGIADGAEVNVNADWNSTSGDSLILNKPEIPTKTSDLDNDGEDGISPFISQIAVQDFPDRYSFPTIGQNGVVYIAEDTDLAYTWDSNAMDYALTTMPDTGITGIGKTNRVAKFTSPTNIVWSRISEDQFGAIKISDSNRPFLSGNSVLSIQRPQNQLDFVMGNSNINQPVEIISDNTGGGLEIKSRGILSLKAGASYLEGIKVLTNGKLQITQSPDTGTTSDLVLVRDSSGNVKTVAYPVVSERRNANNSTNNNINYCGTAATGSSESSAVWSIDRLTISSSGSVTTATATNVAWTNRESAIYI